MNEAPLTRVAFNYHEFSETSAFLLYIFYTLFLSASISNLFCYFKRWSLLSKTVFCDCYLMLFESFLFWKAHLQLKTRTNFFRGHFPQELNPLRQILWVLRVFQHNILLYWLNFTSYLHELRSRTNNFQLEPFRRYFTVFQTNWELSHAQTLLISKVTMRWLLILQIKPDFITEHIGWCN